MKQQIEKLVALDLDPELFYNISLWENELKLQGFGSQSLFSKLKSLGFSMDFDAEYGWLNAKKDGIAIILTFKPY
jgi:hypothetical protein